MPKAEVGNDGEAAAEADSNWVEMSSEEEARADVPECYYPNHQTVQTEGRIVTAKNTHVHHSVYKLAAMARLINGQHLHDAQAYCAATPRKSAEAIGKVLNSARNNAKARGLMEEKLFVKSIICGKGFLLKKIDIKGRSRMGMIKKPKCSVSIVLEEKPMESFYEMIISGKCPPGAARQLKTVLV